MTFNNPDKIAKFSDKCIMIKIHQETEYKRGSLYEAVRHCWKISIDRANQADYVLAVINGIVRGVFKPKGSWYHTPEKKCKEINCSDSDIPCGRKMFNGEKADKNAQLKYLNKYIPDEYRKSRNPIQYSYKYSK